MSIFNWNSSPQTSSLILIRDDLGLQVVQVLTLTYTSAIWAVCRCSWRYKQGYLSEAKIAPSCFLIALLLAYRRTASRVETQLQSRHFLKWAWVQTLCRKTRSGARPEISWTIEKHWELHVDSGCRCFVCFDSIWCNVNRLSTVISTKVTKSPCDSECLTVQSLRDWPERHITMSDNLCFSVL